MATVKGENATKAQAVPKELVDVTEQGGRMRILYDKYTAPGALSINDVIQMGGLLPSGAMVHEVVLASDDLGTTGTLDVGWEASADGAEAADANGFLNAVDVNAAQIVQPMTALAASNAAPGFGKKFSAPVQLAVTASAATTAGGDIRLWVYYTLD